MKKIGIEIGSLKLNLPKMMKNKEKAVTILTKGIEFLFKKIKLPILKELDQLQVRMKYLLNQMKIKLKI